MWACVFVSDKLQLIQLLQLISYSVKLHTCENVYPKSARKGVTDLRLIKTKSNHTLHGYNATQSVSQILRCWKIEVQPQQHHTENLAHTKTTGANGQIPKAHRTTHTRLSITYSPAAQPFDDRSDHPHWWTPPRRQVRAQANSVARARRACLPCVNGMQLYHHGTGLYMASSALNRYQLILT